MTIEEAYQAVERALAVYGLAELSVSEVAEVMPEVAVEAANGLRAAVRTALLAVVDGLADELGRQCEAAHADCPCPLTVPWRFHAPACRMLRDHLYQQHQLKERIERLGQAQ